MAGHSSTGRPGFAREACPAAATVEEPHTNGQARDRRLVSHIRRSRIARPVAQSPARSRLRDPLPHPGCHHSAAAGRQGCRRARTDRYRQDCCVRVTDPAAPGLVAESPAGAGPGAYPGTRAAGVRGVRALRGPHARREGAAGLRRAGIRRATQRLAARCAHRGRDAGPDHGPLGQAHAGPVRTAVPRPRRSRRDAEHGLRRGRRDHPRADPGRQGCGAVLGDHAQADPATCRAIPR